MLKQKLLQTVGLAVGMMLTSACGADGATGVTIESNLTDFKVNSSMTTFQAGAVSFTANNTGQEMHELALIRTDFDPNQLPTDATGGAIETATGMTLIAEAEAIAPGAKKTFNATVTPGNYVLICNTIANGKKHYQLGMAERITVTA